MCANLLLATANQINCNYVNPPLTFHYEGFSSGYDFGVMKRVIQIRQNHEDYPYLPSALPKVDGYIAVLHCQHVGRIAYVQINDVVLKTLVVDCASPSAYEWMISNRYALEFDYFLWQKYGSQWVDVEIKK